MTVRRIIREEGLRPYKIQHVQALHPNDYAYRRNFCRWMLRKLQYDPRFFHRFLFTDESSFSSCSILNRQNARIWAYRNPRTMVERLNQGRFTINVWAGIIGDHIIGPIYLTAPLTSATYLQFLRSRFLRELRQIIPRHRRHFIYFMHDGAPPHYGLPVRHFLNEMFGTRWIGRRPAPHLWPPRSPDLTPLDFFLWGAVKEIVYSSGRQFNSSEQLKRRIKYAFRRLQSRRDIGEKIRRNLEARIRECLNRNGGHIEAGSQARLLRMIRQDGAVLWVRGRSRRRRL